MKYKWLLYLNHCYLIAGLIIFSIITFDDHLFISIIAAAIAFLSLLVMKPMVKQIDASKPNKRIIKFNSILLACFTVAIVGGIVTADGVNKVSVFLLFYVTIDLIYNLLKFSSYKKEIGRSL